VVLGGRVFWWPLLFVWCGAAGGGVCGGSFEGVGPEERL
jgi:hypothetical protein